MKSYFTPLRPTDYRGPLAIHAARVLDVASSPDRLCMAALGSNWINGLPHSAMVAVADLVDVVPAEDVVHRLTRADREAGNFARGRFAWRLTNIRSIRRPIPAPGRQGLFNWRAPDDLHDRLGPVLDHLLLSHRIGWGLFSRVLDA